MDLKTDHGRRAIMEREMVQTPYALDGGNVASIDVALDLISGRDLQSYAIMAFIDVEYLLTYLSDAKDMAHSTFM